MPHANAQLLARFLHTAVHASSGQRPSHAAPDAPEDRSWLVLHACRAALSRLLQQLPHCFLGMASQEVQDMAHAACEGSGQADESAQPAADDGEGEADAAAAASIEATAASMGAAVRAHVLELEEAAAMQARRMADTLHLTRNNLVTLLGLSRNCTQMGHARWPLTLARSPV